LAKKGIAKPDEAFQAPMDAFTHWLSSDFESLGHRQKTKINQGLISDIFGEPSTPITRKRSKRDKLRARFGYALLSLLSSYHRFDRVRKMVSHFPRKDSGISKGDHLENCAVILFNEVYVLETRLKSFLNECHAIEMELLSSSHIEPGKIVRVYQKAFKGFLAVRGSHTHRGADFEDGKIRRVKLIELLMMSKEFHFFEFFRRQAIKEAKGFWLERVEDVEKAAQQILVLAFKQVRPLREALFPPSAKRQAKRNKPHHR
jgi:hypothetical protein